MQEPWLILRVPEGSAYIYAMPASEEPKKWSLKILGQILKQEKIQIETNSLGKPCLPRGMGFANWSNSKKECILAYSKECEVGIDLEFYRERNFEAISKRFFAYSEATSKAEKFYHLWTKKEAYYKCAGGKFFSVLKNDLYPNAKIWNLQGPYKEEHEIAICLSRS
jgi:phosphopantetheinyl transferase